MEMAPGGGNARLLRRSRALRRRKLLIDEDRDHHGERARENPIDPSGAPVRRGAWGPEFRPLEAFRRRVEHPGEQEGNRKTQHEEQKDRTRDPGRQLQNRRHIADELDQHPRHHGTGTASKAPRSQARQHVSHIRNGKI